MKISMKMKIIISKMNFKMIMRILIKKMSNNNIIKIKNNKIFKTRKKNLNDNFLTSFLIAQI